MKKKSVLVTCDDGFESLGIRTLIHALKKEYEVVFAVTQTQQSGVGGRIHVKDGCMWKRTTVGEVEGIVVDGSPVDAVDCVRGVFRKKFDYVVSGINMGSNLGGTVISSGTFAAAYAALNFGTAGKAVVISWDVGFSLLFKDHKETDIHEGYDEHPGKDAIGIVKKAMENDLWGAVMLNINVPYEKSKGIRVMELDVPALEFWPRGIPDEASGKFTYPPDDHANTAPEGTDAWAINEGYISITPIDIRMRDEASFKRLKKIL